jgi:hypothetical protein
MTNTGFAQLPPDVDFADPDCDTMCPYCGCIEDDGDCVVCFPRCRLDDSPIISCGYVIEAGTVRAMEVAQ